jgi:hypothetical protein
LQYLSFVHGKVLGVYCVVTIQGVMILVGALYLEVISFVHGTDVI